MKTRIEQTPESKPFPKVGEAFTICDNSGNPTGVFMRIEDEAGRAKYGHTASETAKDVAVYSVSLATGKVTWDHIDELYLSGFTLLEPLNGELVFRVKK